MATLKELNHAYNRGYWDGKQGRPKQTAAWQGDELIEYKQGYAEGMATIHPSPGSES